MMERRGEESERLVDLDEGAARVGDAAQPQRQVHDQTHHHAIIIGAKMWESKRRKDRELDGMERAGQNKRDGQGKQAKELESRQRWRLLQMHLCLPSFPRTHKHAQQSLQSTPSLAPLVTTAVQHIR